MQSVRSIKSIELDVQIICAPPEESSTAELLMLNEYIDNWLIYENVLQGNFGPISTIHAEAMREASEDFVLIVTAQDRLIQGKLHPEG